MDPLDNERSAYLGTGKRPQKTAFGIKNLHPVIRGLPLRNK